MSRIMLMRKKVRHLFSFSFEMIITKESSLCCNITLRLHFTIFSQYVYTGKSRNSKSNVSILCLANPHSCFHSHSPSMSRTVIDQSKHRVRAPTFLQPRKVTRDPLECTPEPALVLPLSPFAPEQRRSYAKWRKPTIISMRKYMYTSAPLRTPPATENHLVMQNNRVYMIFLHVCEAKKYQSQTFSLSFCST